MANNLSGLDFNAYSFMQNKLVVKQNLFAEIIRQENNLWNISIMEFSGVKNQGFGSILIKEFFKYIKQFPVEKVTGFLSNFDTQISEENEKMLHYFYGKHGFDILGDKMIFKFKK